MNIVGFFTLIIISVILGKQVCKLTDRKSKHDR